LKNTLFAGAAGHLINCFLFIFLISPSLSYTQSQIEVNGFLQNMQTVWNPKNIENLIFSNSIMNRINLSWYKNNLEVNASLRNIFDYGEFVSLIPFYDKLAVSDDGFFDLTSKIYSGNSYILYSNIDRANIKYTLENLEIQIGRQRVNWGINSVWTPNDIFNSSAFINFDYVEKPGSDAVRIQYYLDFASSIEIVSKLDYKEDLTLAGKLQFNKWDYDFQVISGFSKDDYIFGGGWAGSLFDAGFTGEFTYFNEKSSNLTNSYLFVSSVGANYTFSNSLFISCEFLYNSIGKVGKLSASSDLFNLDYSAKNLSLARYSIFAQVSYPFTPLINSSLSAIINPTDGSLFLSPTTEFSLNEDVYLLISSQFFAGERKTEWGDFGQFYYLRIKWNF